MNFIDINLMKKNSNRWFFCPPGVWSFIAGSTNAPIPARFQAYGVFFCTKMPTTTTKWRKRQKKVGNFHIIPNIDVFRGRVVRFRKCQPAAFWFREKSPSKKSKDFQRNKRREAETLTKKENTGGFYTPQAIAHFFPFGTYGLNHPFSL